MLTDDQRAAARRWLFTRIDRLMAPEAKGVGTKLKSELVKKREAYQTKESRVPTPPERAWIIRCLVNAGLQARTNNVVPKALRTVAERRPDASAPAGLQGSRTPTPMPAWLVSGIGLPLKPPTRRAVSP